MPGNDELVESQRNISLSPPGLEMGQIEKKFRCKEEGMDSDALAPSDKYPQSAKIQDIIF
jgi:hypothetical protein